MHIGIFLHFLFRLKTSSVHSKSRKSDISHGTIDDLASKLIFFFAFFAIIDLFWCQLIKCLLRNITFRLMKLTLDVLKRNKNHGKKPTVPSWDKPLKYWCNKKLCLKKLFLSKVTYEISSHWAVTYPMIRMQCLFRRGTNPSSLGLLPVYFRLYSSVDA